MSVAVDSLLVTSPEICGGRMRIEGTRITIHQIATLYKLGYGAEDIAGQYPQLSLAQIYAALAFYHANREEVESLLSVEMAEAGRLEQEFLERQGRA